MLLSKVYMAGATESGLLKCWGVNPGRATEQTATSAALFVHCASGTPEKATY